jgi:murein DD-endopeptidase MepM/ murein hydrolase activator NlpD
MDEERKLTILLIPDGGGETRSLHIPYTRLRALAVAGVAVVVILGGVVGSWWFLAARAQEASGLHRDVALLEEDLLVVEELARTLVEVEAAYENLRSLFGDPEQLGRTDFLPPALGWGAATPAAGDDSTLPTAWPLTERGFLTQPLLEGAGTGEEHPGIDIAVPAGSYIRAAGPGTVVETGEDSVYGLYLMIDHGGGYRTLYAHASHLTAEHGDRVRRGQVIGLTGSSGRSTAPHLHFEILRDGEPIDPLELVQRP